jgi:hypothetical protein
MAKLGILIGPIVLLLCIFCVVDVITNRGEPRHLPRWAWLILVLLFPFVGSVVWLVAGRPGRVRGTAGPADRHQRRSTAFPEYDRPGRIAAQSTEADEEFLRQCRERAEEQRRRYREQQEQQRRESGDPDGSAT